MFVNFIYISTLLISAFLLFSLQLLVAKIMLPVLGGSPNVWITTNLFFQVLLLVGYCLSTVLSRISWGRYIYLVGVLSMAFLLPSQLQIDITTVPDQPVKWILGYLLTNVGAIGLLMCTVAPLSQFWYGKVKVGSNPYLLYAASNLGSFLGILVYPLVIEPRLGLNVQFEFWHNIYFGLLVLLLCVVATTLVIKNVAVDSDSDDNNIEGNVSTPTASDRLRWVFLAAVPVSLSLSLTSYITQDLGSFPLLWILPLGLYLLSYIRGFKSLNKPTFFANQYKYIAIAFVVLGFNSSLPIPHQIKFVVSTILFYQLSKSIHNYLYESRPLVLFLPQFYLFTALGGVCGGLINAIVAPTAYKFTIEYAICLLLCILINPSCSITVTTHDVRNKLILGSGYLLKRYNVQPSFLDRNNVSIILLSSIAIEYILFYGDWYQLNFKMLIGLLVPLILFAVAALKFESSTYQKVMVLTSIIGILFVFKPFGSYLFADRSYFGNLQVIRSNSYGGSRMLLHGITLHGFQSNAMMDNPPTGLNAPPLSYYTAVKELAETMSGNYARPIKIGMVGMGTGISAIYTSDDDTFDFYEIDPLVVKIATDNNYFSYINKSPAKVNIIQGDARLSLAKSNEKYDLLVLDAFTSDAIPTHLLTQEAFRIYQNRLADDGVMLVHISNRYFDLSQSVASTANSLSFTTVAKKYEPTKESASIGEGPSKWLAVGSDTNLTKFVPKWNPVELKDGISVWTDNYSNLLQSLRLLGI